MLEDPPGGEGFFQEPLPLPRFCKRQGGEDVLNLFAEARLRKHLRVETSPEEPLPCYIWGASDKRFSFRGRRRHVRHFIYEACIAELLPEMEVTQRCHGGRICVQPFHLYARCFPDGEKTEVEVPLPPPPSVELRWKRQRVPDSPARSVDSNLDEPRDDDDEWMSSILPGSPRDAESSMSWELSSSGWDST